MKWTLFWSSVDRFSSAAVSLLIGVVLARLLDPKAYGLVGIVSIFIAIAQLLVDSGLSNGLIQKKNCREIDFSTIFCSNVLVSIFLYAIIYFIAPYIASFYDEQMLIPVMRLLGLNLLLMSFYIVHKTKLIIELRFKRIALISSLSVVIGGAIGIFSAWKGLGVYSLLYQTLSMGLVQLIGYSLLSSWKFSLRFSRQSFVELFSFGSKLMLGSVMNTVYRNLYSLLIGRFYGSADVGLMSKASVWAAVPAQYIGTVINQVAYPVLCAQDRTHLESDFFRYLRLSYFFVAPLSGLFIVLAEPLILLLLKDQWESMIPIFQILVLSRILDPIKWYNWQIMNVYGKSGQSLKAETIAKSLSIIILLLSLKQGVLWLCWTLVIYSVYDAAITYVISVKISGIRMREQFLQLSPIFLATGVLMFTAYIFSLLMDSYFIQLLTGVVMGVVAYLFVAKLMNIKEVEFLMRSFLAVKKDEESY